MKNLIALLSFILISKIGFSQSKVSVPYTVAKNYFLRNDAGLVFNSDGTARDFILIESTNDLENFFGYATIMGPNGTPTKIDFNTQFAVALVNPTNEKVSKISVKSLEKSKDDLLLTYETTIDNKATYKSNAFAIVIIDKKNGGPIRVTKVNSATNTTPLNSKDKVQVKSKTGNIYVYERKVFDKIASYFTNLLQTELTSPAKTYNEKYQPYYNDPKPGTDLAFLKDNNVFFTARNGWAEFTALYAYFLKQMNGTEKSSLLRKQLYQLYDASLSLEINLGANGTFTGDIGNALEAYVEFDIAQMNADKSKNEAEDKTHFEAKKAAYISTRSKQINKFLNTKYKTGEEPYNLQGNAKQAKANLNKLKVGITSLKVLQALEAFDTKFKQSE